MPDKKNVIIAGLSPRFFINQIAIMKEYSISMIADSSEIKEKMNEYMGCPIGTFEEIKNYDYDEILIVSRSRCISIIKMLLSMGIDREKIVIWNPKLCLNDSEYSLKVDENGSIKASIHKGDTRINATFCAFSDLVVFEEIYLQNIYRFVSEEETVLFDVGMNIGLASLFFASKGFIKKVYGFEPFKPTFERALKNLSLNEKSLSEKIQGFNYGLGDKDGEQTAHYLANNPGIMRAGKEAVAADPGDGSVEIAVIKEAGPEILRIMDENPEASFAMKIDCEGAEYEIVPNLIKHGVLKRISIVVMETHYGREDEIIEAFRKEGFVVYSNEEAPFRTGTLFALRKERTS